MLACSMRSGNVSGVASVNLVAGAADVVFRDGSRVWCPPKAVAGFTGGDVGRFSDDALGRPYWTAGARCRPQRCGQDLSEGDAEALGVREAVAAVLGG